MSSTEAAPLSTSGLGLGAAIGALSDRRNSRLSRAVGLYLLGAAAYKGGKEWWGKQQQRHKYTIAVPADDDVYPELHSWLLEQLPPGDRRALTARTGRTSSHMPMAVDSVGGERSRPQLRLFYDSTKNQNVKIDGHDVAVGIEREGDGGGKEDKDSFGAWLRRERIVFTASGEDARDAVLAVLDTLMDGMVETREPRVYIAAQWGGWSHREDLPIRPIDTVILPAGQKEALLADLRLFLASERKYVSMGIPYHRCFLFHGPPGTGKTSLAKALAADIGYDLRYIPLSMVRTDGAFLELVNAVGPRSVLLLEDIDIAHGAKERDDGEPGVTLAGLLNGLDGVATPHGMVVMMTTNDRSVLDDALVRPGRVDREAYIGHLDDDQLTRLVGLLTGGRPHPLPPLRDRQVAPAALIELFKRNLDHPAAAVTELHAFLAGSDTTLGGSIPVPQEV